MSVMKSTSLMIMGSLILGQLSQAQSNSYCMAIRGNGELMPAHWGAMAQSVETFGMPSGVAGGSSASISAFMMDSLALNPLVKNSRNSVEQALRASFLLKSMQGFGYAIMDDKKWQHTLILANKIGQQDFSELKVNIETITKIINGARENLSQEEIQLISDVLLEVKQTQIFTGPAIMKLIASFDALRSHYSLENFRNFKNQAVQVQRAISVFGKFDAKNDQTLFLRDGLINFKSLGHAFGRMAAFYSLKSATDKTVSEVQSFVDKYASQNVGKSWIEIIQANPSVQQELSSLIKNYFQNDGKTANRIQEPMSQGLNTLITTSVVVGDSRKTLLEQKKSFDATFDDKLAEVLNVNAEDIKFGYWGTTKNLAKIEAEFTDTSKFQLAKSKRFLKLGMNTWETALSTSPAEPGLSTLVPFKTASGEDLISLGGWSDLHPVPVLKAMGCEQVVYLTRKGGDSLFGQGVAKRLFKLSDESIPWKNLDESKESAVANKKGRAEDQTSDWSMMYNLANPRSSYAASVAAADAVVCTDWNAFDIKKDYSAMITEAYKALIYMSKNIELTNLVPGKWIQKSDNKTESDGSPTYPGCIPN